MRRVGNTFRILAAGLLTAASSALFGCGGGGNGEPGPADVSGIVTTTTGGRATSVVLPGATVKAFVWPDTTTAAATTTTDSVGHYKVTLPGSAVTNDIVITAEKTMGTPPANCRLSTIVAQLPEAGTTAANVDPSTTMAAEVVANRARTLKAGDISGPCFVTVLEEIRTNMTGVDSESMVVGGTELPTAFGNGLKANSDCDKFVKANAVITAALASAWDTSSGDVRQAKRISQMLRDTANTINVAANLDRVSLQSVIQEESAALQAGSDLATAFADRMKFPATMMTRGAATQKTDEGLIGKAPGVYEQVKEAGSNVKTLKPATTPPKPDDKSWVVISKVPGSAMDQVLTITPQTKVAVFGVSATSPQMTMTVRKAADASLKYDGTLKVIEDSATVPTKVTIDLTLNDNKLTKPIAIQGTLTGSPAEGATGSYLDYVEVGYGGTITSQFGNSTVERLAVQWATSAAAGDVQQVSATNLILNRGTENPTTLTVASGSITYLQPDPAHGFPSATVNTISALNAVVKNSAYELDIANGTAGFARIKPTTGDPVVLLNQLNGSLTYKSSTMTFSGNAMLNWENASLLTSAVTNFPKGRFHLAGTLTPKSGSVISTDLTVVSDNKVSASNTVTATLNIVKLTYGAENLTGTVAATYAVANNLVQKNPTITANLTHSPSQYVAAVSGPADNLAGSIKDSGGVTKAEIGKANALGINGPGDKLVIRYVDNSFETLDSILP